MIERCPDAFPVRLMCRRVQVSPSGFYAWAGRRAPSARQRANARLLSKIHEIHAESGQVYGTHCGHSCRPRSIYIERFYNPNRRRELARTMAATQLRSALTEPSVETA